MTSMSGARRQGEVTRPGAPSTDNWLQSPKMGALKRLQPT
eukprot:CAMPEP_0181451570 /NCGR_PEP_ID=MMETSP1110-20121109/28760_1 /TAXON_ID=174948 /ORGANISM="Symbiodinium sp., Strain CCMP421" /LENGTH=39 /DNA_ID= /DNA_START= /DNA_END= /DNA_ORIENTATION=